MAKKKKGKKEPKERLDKPREQLLSFTSAEEKKLLKLATEYAEARDERMAWGKVEKARQESLKKFRTDKGITVPMMLIHGASIEFQPRDEKVIVRLGEEIGPEPVQKPKSKKGEGSSESEAAVTKMPEPTDPEPTPEPEQV